MLILSLDIGTRRTGCAFGDSDMGVPLSLPTLHHESEEELVEKVLVLARDRKVDRIVVGLPLLLSGQEGSQVTIVRRVAQALEKNGFSVIFIDERYTSPAGPSADSDAEAASSILLSYFEKNSD